MKSGGKNCKEGSTGNNCFIIYLFCPFSNNSTAAILPIRSPAYMNQHLLSGDSLPGICSEFQNYFGPMAMLAVWDIFFY